jgi:hypothetical protein
MSGDDGAVGEMARFFGWNFLGALGATAAILFAQSNIWLLLFGFGVYGMCLFKGLYCFTGG